MDRPVNGVRVMNGVRVIRFTFHHRHWMKHRSRRWGFQPRMHSVRDRWISEPSAVAQLEDAIVELVVSDMGQDPFQAGENGAAVGLAQRYHDDSAVAVEQMRDGVNEIPIRGKQNVMAAFGKFSSSKNFMPRPRSRTPDSLRGGLRIPVPPRHPRPISRGSPRAPSPSYRHRSTRQGWSRPAHGCHGSRACHGKPWG